MAVSTRSKEILTGLTILALTVGLFLCGELALRVAQWNSFGQLDAVEQSEHYYIDEETGLRLNVPNRQLGKIRINNLGFRGPDLPVTKHPGTIRLAFLGSSTTYGAYAPEGKNWPHLVAEKLSQKLEICDLDFINAGKPGYDMASVGKLFSSYVKDTQPDLVLLMSSDINAALDTAAQSQGLNVDHQYYRSALADYSVLLNRLEKNFHIVKLQRAAASRREKLVMEQQLYSRQFAEKYANLLRQLSSEGALVGAITLSSRLSRDMEFRDLVAAGNTQLYHMPYLYLPDMLDLYAAYNQVIAETAQRHGAITIDGEARVSGKSQHFVDSVHLTPLGSEVMASRVADKLLASEQFTALVNERGCGLVDGDIAVAIPDNLKKPTS